MINVAEQISDSDTRLIAGQHVAIPLTGQTTLGMHNYIGTDKLAADNGEFISYWYRKL